jgi:hypothetical protein
MIYNSENTEKGELGLLALNCDHAFAHLTYIGQRN